MKKLYFLTGLIFLTVSSYAQQSAVTQTGEQVTLYNDGTWTYVNKDSINTNEITTNSEKYSRSDKSSFLLKSTRLGVGCYMDPKKWTFKKGEDNEPAEYEINDIENGLYGMMITEKLDLPLESLANIALDNARDAAPDVKIIKKEYRYVNGLKVLMMRMTGTIQNIKFSYYGYYYSTSGGATQFLVYSSEEIVDQHISDIEELLNGFVVIN
ncbi:MAG: hypothetical protein IPP15_10955 [Saprospiraceae bacterium]|uniref:Uncharacterized protein n=1 Tax=Candidatus Opimibacter skivensis TaxID=2982028 RepID=A0A9D7STA0_9BACT|nr:hypothetical protein [Candidatus Opimibacter skivensis]